MGGSFSPVVASTTGGASTPTMRLFSTQFGDRSEVVEKAQKISQNIRDRALQYHHRALSKIDAYLGRPETVEKLEMETIRDKYDLSAPSRSRTVTSTAEWQRFEAHARYMKKMDLKSALMDDSRSQALTAEFEGSFLDYSRMLSRP